MEILATKIYAEPGILGLAVVVLGILIALIGLYNVIGGAVEGEPTIVMFGVLLIFVGVLGISRFHDVDETVYVKHKVLVEDFNIIYEQGYEITEQDGEIVTIQKEKGAAE